MPNLTLRLARRVRFIILCWAMLLGGVVMLLLLLTRGVMPGALGWAIFAGVLGWLWWYTGRYQLQVWVQGAADGSGQLCFAKGHLLARRRILPYHGIYTYTLYTTPLLRLAHCSILICHTLGKPIYLPPFADDDLAPLLHWLAQRP